MKKVFSIIGTIIFVAIIALGLAGNLWRLVSFLEYIGDGAIWVGAIKLPFLALGVVQIMRCSIFLMTIDSEKFKHYSLFVLYLIASFAGIALFLFF